MSFLLSQLRTARTALPSAARAFSTSPSRSVARMTIVGRLGTDVEIKSTNNGTELGSYAVGVNSTVGPKDAQGNRPTSWFRVTNFNIGEEGSKQREYFQGLEKGTLVYVEGDASMATYTDKDTQQTRTALNIVQRNLEVLKRAERRDDQAAQELQAATA